MHIACLAPTDAVASALCAHLSLAGMQAARCDDINALLHQLRRGFFQAIVIEDVDGRIDDWLAIVRERLAGELPLVVVSARFDARGAACAFSAGACDYVSLTQAADLPLRLSAHCAARRLRESKVLEIGGYVLRRDTMSVRRDGLDVLLTPREFALAWALFASAGKVVSLSRLAAQVWGHEADISKRTIEQHVYKLRTKLGIGNRPGSRIQAVYSVGYRLDIEAARSVGGLPATPLRRRGDASLHGSPA